MRKTMQKTKWIAVVLLLSMLLAAGCAGPEKTAEEVNYDATKTITMLDGIMTYQPGTAGASLKLYIATFSVLNFAETYDHDTQEPFLREDIQTYLDGLSEEQVLQIADALPEVNALAQIVFMDGVASMESALSDAGNPNAYDEYNQEKYELVMDVLESVI